MILLSSRQAQVLTLLKAGKSKKEISLELEISVRVVKDHVQRLTELGLTYFRGSKRQFSVKPIEVVDDIRLAIAYGSLGMVASKRTT